MGVKEAIDIDTSLFDLIAVLYEEITKFGKVKPQNTITKEMSDALESKVKDLIYGKFSENKILFDSEMRVNLQDFYDIITSKHSQNQRFCMFARTLNHK